MRITLWTDKEVNENELAVLKALHARGFAVCVFTPDEMVNTLQEEVEDAMAEAGWRQIHFNEGEEK
jgi:ATP-dependent Clp protease adapter protein ClpS